MNKRKAFTLGEIVRRCGGELIGDPALKIARVAALDSATAADLSFVAQARYLPQIENSAAAAFILHADARDATTRIAATQKKFVQPVDFVRLRSSPS